MSKIIADPEILGGKPTVAGTRISVAHILGLLSSGMSESQIIESYPVLTAKDIHEVLQYASQALANDVIINLDAPRESR
jgi:uncharacterized protein (DUF433 family)